jgi:membrane protein required for colicin V production
VLATLDWVVLAVMLVSLLLGLWRGLVYEVLSVLSWIAAFVLAQWFAPEVAGWLPMEGFAEPLRYAAGFLAVFVATLFAGGLLAWITKKLVEAVGLRPVDRVLGALFGIARGVVVVLALAVVVHLTGMRTTQWWQDSMAAGVATAALRGLKPAVPEQFGKHLPD